MKILIMGLSNAGKTTLAKKISAKTGWPIINGDDVRNTTGNHDYSFAGRVLQALHMKHMSKTSQYYSASEHVLYDFICPTKHTRSLFDPDFVVYVNTLNPCPYEDTVEMFDPPSRGEWDVRVLSHDDRWVDFIIDKILDKETENKYGN